MLSPLPFPHFQETHLWQLHLPAAYANYAQWQTWLSADERDRAQRLVQATDRRRFCLSRAGLRYLLSRYLDCPPSEISLRYGHYGKPELDLPHPPLYFNLAHSGDWAIYGMSQHPWVGVDVEQYRELPTLEGLIQRCLTPLEQAHLPTGHPARSHAFFQYWAIKEAHLKAIGVGLGYGMQCIQVAPLPHPHLVCAAQVSGMAASDWSITLWQPTPAAIAAACTGSNPHRFILHPFPLPPADLVCPSPPA